jgi:hypothetical protein
MMPPMIASFEYIQELLTTAYQLTVVAAEHNIGVLPEHRIAIHIVKDLHAARINSSSRRSKSTSRSSQGLQVVRDLHPTWLTIVAGPRSSFNSEYFCMRVT